MIHHGIEKKYKVRQSHFPMSIFLMTFFVLLAMAGIHYKIISLLHILNLSNLVRKIIVIFYWMFVAGVYTLFTRWQMRKTYEKPMKQMAEAASAVANGDFSVYLSPIHTPEKLDYLDIMIMDFNRMVEELGSIETLKTDFFSNVSHEIKTPIAVIQNSAELLQSTKLNEIERLEYISTIMEASKKLSTLITNILKLNKLEKQNIKPLITKFNLCNQLCKCALQFEAQWEKKNIDFEADIDDFIIIESDESLLELVWTNLLSNAVKFTNPGGKILLKQRRENDKIIVSVKDNGCGMSRETIKHIFDKFYQGDTSHATEGNGLGLAITHRIIELMDGILSVESELGYGSTFTVKLPIKGFNTYKESAE
ncbi:ATP-binding protein [Clostridium sp.]